VKKIFTSLIVVMVMLLPLTSGAKSLITEKDLGDVTAQEGVTINFDCFTMGAVSVNVASWGDSDGCASCGGLSTVGWIGASVTMSTNFIKLSGNMTVDVGTSGTRSALIIGLPTVNLAGSMTDIVMLASSAQLTGGTAKILGTSYMSGVSFNPSGYVAIYAH